MSQNTKNIEYSGRTYLSRSSAVRAMRGYVGRRMVVEPPELENRFEGEVRLRPEMLFVEEHDGGWRFGWEYTLDDVVVNVLGEDLTTKQVPYASVSLWEHASAHAAHVMALRKTCAASLTISREERIGDVFDRAAVTYTGEISFQDAKAFLIAVLVNDDAELVPQGSQATTIGSVTVVTQGQS